jgi:hypothetical protein
VTRPWVGVGSERKAVELGESGSGADTAHNVTRYIPQNRDPSSRKERHRGMSNQPPITHSKTPIPSH